MPAIIKIRPTFWIIFIVCLLDSTANGFIIPVIIKLLDIQHPFAELSYISQDTSVNFIFTIALSPTYLLALPLMGACSDYWGRKKFFIISLLSSGLCFIFLGASIFIHSIPLILFSIAFFGIGLSTLWLGQAMIADIARGLVRAKWIGLIFINLIIELAASSISYQLHWLSLTAVMTSLGLEICGIVLALCYLPETRTLKLQKPLDKLYTLSQSIIEFFYKKEPGLLLIIFTLYEFIGELYYQYIQYLTDIHQLNSQEATWFTFCRLGLTILAYAIFYPWLLQRFKTYKILYGCAILGPLAYLVCVSFDSELVQWLLLFPIVILRSTIRAVLCTKLINHCSYRQYGTVAGLTGLAWSIAWVGSGITTVLLGKYNLKLSLSLISFVMMIVFYLLIFRLRMFRANLNPI